MEKKLLWSNVINVLLLIIIVLMFSGVFDKQRPFSISDQILSYVQQSNARAAIVLDDKGRAKVINANAEEFKECSVGPEGPLPQCKGFGVGGTILQVERFTVFRSRGSNCYEVIDGNGVVTEYCW